MSVEDCCRFKQSKRSVEYLHTHARAYACTHVCTQRHARTHERANINCFILYYVTCDTAFCVFEIRATNGVSNVTIKFYSAIPRNSDDVCQGLVVDLEVTQESDS